MQAFITGCNHVGLHILTTRVQQLAASGVQSFQTDSSVVPNQRQSEELAGSSLRAKKLSRGAQQFHSPLWTEVFLASSKCICLRPVHIFGSHYTSVYLCMWTCLAFAVVSVCNAFTTGENHVYLCIWMFWVLEMNACLSLHANMCDIIPDIGEVLHAVQCPHF